MRNRNKKLTKTQLVSLNFLKKERDDIVNDIEKRIEYLEQLEKRFEECKDSKVKQIMEKQMNHTSNMIEILFDQLYLLETTIQEKFPAKK